MALLRDVFAAAAKLNEENTSRRREQRNVTWPSIKHAADIANQAMGAASKAKDFDLALWCYDLMNKEPEMKITLFGFGCAMGAALKGGYPERALSIMDTMINEGCEPDIIMYGCAITALTRLERWKDAVLMLNRVTASGLKPNVVHYTAALQAVALGAKGEEGVQTVLDLLDRMRLEGVKPNRVTYAQAISACTAAVDISKALSLLRDMKSEGIEPDLIVYNSLLQCASAAASNIPAQSDDIAQPRPVTLHCPSLLAEMRSLGIPPTTLSHSFAVTEAARAGGAQAALTALADAVQNLMGPEAEETSVKDSENSTKNPIQLTSNLANISIPGGRRSSLDGDQGLMRVFNCCLDALAKEGRAEQALQLMRTAQAAGLTPTVVTYTMVLNACGVAGNRWEMANNILSELEALEASGARDGSGDVIGPNAFSYGAAMGAGGHKEAKMLLKRMRLHGLKPNSVVHAASLKACKLENTQESYTALLDMLKAAPAEELGNTCTADKIALGAAASRGDWQTALRLLDAAQRRGAFLDGVCYGFAAIACVNAEEWKRARELVTEIEKRELDAEEGMYMSAITTCNSNISLEASRTAHHIATIAIRIASKHPPGGLNRASRIASLAMKGCSDWKSIQELRLMVEATGVQGTFLVGIRNAALSSLARCGEWVRALELILQFANGPNPTAEASHYSALLDVCSASGDWQRSLHIFSKMEERYITQSTSTLNGLSPSRAAPQPSSAQYSAVIHALSVGGKAHEAMNLLDKAHKDDVRLGVGVYAGAVVACKRAGEAEMAFRVIMLMRERGVTPTVSTYACAVAACTVNKQSIVI